MNPNRVRVRRATTGGQKNWIIEDRNYYDDRRREFVFTNFRRAIHEANRLARTEMIHPADCVSVQRIGWL